jgi:hypothetical protein
VTTNAPTLFLLDDLGANSHRVEIRPKSIARGSTVELRLEANGNVTFVDNDPAANQYAVQVQRVDPTGAESAFLHEEVQVPGTSLANANIQAWDGGALQVAIGGVSQTLPNQGGFKTWLPTVNK